MPTNPQPTHNHHVALIIVTVLVVILGLVYVCYLNAPK